MNNERQTKISNQILYNLFKRYSVKDIRIFTAIINRLLSKHKAMKKNGADEKDFLSIGISLKFFNEYKGKKHLSVIDILEIIENIGTFGILTYENGVYKRITVINQVEYDERYKSFKIYFNENAIEYLIMIENKFTLLDLNIIKKLKSKYELGLYILIQMYKDTGIVIKNINGLKDYFNTGGSTNDLMKYLKVAALKLNSNYDYKIKFDYEKVGKRIDLVKIKFKK